MDSSKKFHIFAGKNNEMGWEWRGFDDYQQTVWGIYGIRRWLKKDENAFFDWYQICYTDKEGRLAQDKTLSVERQFLTGDVSDNREVIALLQNNKFVFVFEI